MGKSIIIALPSETNWVIFARWIIAIGLLLWSTLYIVGFWRDDSEMMLFNCFNLMAFLGFGISMLLILIDPTHTVVINDDDD